MITIDKAIYLLQNGLEPNKEQLKGIIWHLNQNKVISNLYENSVKRHTDTRIELIKVRKDLERVLSNGNI